MSKIKIIDDPSLDCGSRFLTPNLLNWKQKGQGGTIGIIGGSYNNSGAPYFTGMASLRTGADSVHVICPDKEAGNCIKSYGPSLIIHSVVNALYTEESMKMWLPKKQIIVIGPGLDLKVPYTVKDALKAIIKTCRSNNTPLILDGEAMLYLAEKPDLLKNYPGLILTPNNEEFKRLFGNEDPHNKISNSFGNKCIVLKKGQIDEIYSADSKAVCAPGGSARRSDGQGDFLAGVLATFYCWALQKTYDQQQVFCACYAASKLTRECNARAFKKLGRAMLTKEMLEEISDVFKETYEAEETV